MEFFQYSIFYLYILSQNILNLFNFKKEFPHDHFVHYIFYFFQDDQFQCYEFLIVLSENYKI